MTSSDGGLDVSAGLPMIITSSAVAPPFVPSSLHGRPSSHAPVPLSRSPSASRRARRTVPRRPHTSDGGVETDSVSSSFAAAAAAQAQALSRQASVDTLTASLAAVSAQRRARNSLVAQPPGESPSSPLPPVPAVPHHIPASPVLVSPSARTASDSPFRCKTCSKHAWDASSSHAIGERCLHMRTRKRPSTTPERSDGSSPPPCRLSELSGILPAPPSRFELRAQDAERRAQVQQPSPVSRSPKRATQLQQQAAVSRTKSLDISRPRDGFVDAPVDVLPEPPVTTPTPNGLGLELSPSQSRHRRHASRDSEFKNLRFQTSLQKPTLENEHGLTPPRVGHSVLNSRLEPEPDYHLPVSHRFSSSTANSMPVYTPEGIEVKDEYFDLPQAKTRRPSKGLEEVAKIKLAQVPSMHASPLLAAQPAVAARAAIPARQASHGNHIRLPAMPPPASILQEQEQIVGYCLTPGGSPASITLSLSTVSGDESPRSRRTLQRVPSTPATTPPTSYHGSIKSPRQNIPSLPSSPVQLSSPSSKEKAAAHKAPPAPLTRPISQHSVFQYNATKGSAAARAEKLAEKHAEEQATVGRKRGFWAGLSCFG